MYAREDRPLSATATLRALSVALLGGLARLGIHATRPSPLRCGAALRASYLLVISFDEFLERKTALLTLIRKNGHERKPPCSCPL